MSERRYFEHYTTDEPPRLDRWYCCECCRLSNDREQLRGLLDLQLV